MWCKTRREFGFKGLSGAYNPVYSTERKSRNFSKLCSVVAHSRPIHLPIGTCSYSDRTCRIELTSAYSVRSVMKTCLPVSNFIIHLIATVCSRVTKFLHFCGIYCRFSNLILLRKVALQVCWPVIKHLVI